MGQVGKGCPVCWCGAPSWGKLEMVALCGGVVHLCGQRWKGLPNVLVWCTFVGQGGKGCPMCWCGAPLWGKVERVALCGGVVLCGARWKGLPCVVVWCSFVGQGGKGCPVRWCSSASLWGKAERVALCGGGVQQCIFSEKAERVAQTSSGEVVPVLVGLHPQKLEKLTPMNMVLYLNSV